MSEPTVDNVLHALWTRHTDGDYDKQRDKPLWMLLQTFMERSGGITQPARYFDVTGEVRPSWQTGSLTRPELLDLQCGTLAAMV